MVKLLLPVTAVLLMSITGAQAKKAKDMPAQTPAAETTSLPPDPTAVQKWFGDAVDGILTDTGRILKDPDPKS